MWNAREHTLKYNAPIRAMLAEAGKLLRQALDQRWTSSSSSRLYEGFIEDMHSTEFHLLLLRASF